MCNFFFLFPCELFLNLLKRYFNDLKAPLSLGQNCSLFYGSVSLLQILHQILCFFSMQASPYSPLYVINFLIIILCNFNYRVGVIDVAELHVCRVHPDYQGQLSAQIERVKYHMLMAKIARQDGDWMTGLREIDAVIAAGVDISQSVINANLG